MTSETLEEITIEPLPEDYAQYDLSFKIIVIGDSGVGKSCLTSKAVKNMFIEFYQATIGFEFLTYNLKMNDTIVKLLNSNYVLPEQKEIIIEKEVEQIEKIELLDDSIYDSLINNKKIKCRI